MCGEWTETFLLQRLSRRVHQALNCSRIPWVAVAATMTCTWFERQLTV